MREVIEIFRQIQDTSSLNKKKEIIKANSNNELFKKCLKFLLDSKTCRTRNRIRSIISFQIQ